MYNNLRKKLDDIVEGVLRVMNSAFKKVSGEDRLPILSYEVYDIRNNNLENLLEFGDILQQELIQTDVLSEDLMLRNRRNLFLYSQLMFL